MSAFSPRQMFEYPSQTPAGVSIAGPTTTATTPAGSTVRESQPLSNLESRSSGPKECLDCGRTDGGCDRVVIQAGEPS